MSCLNLRIILSLENNLCCVAVDKLHANPVSVCSEKGWVRISKCWEFSVEGFS